MMEGPGTELLIVEERSGLGLSTERFDLPEQYPFLGEFALHWRCVSSISSDHGVQTSVTFSMNRAFEHARKDGNAVQSAS